MQFDLSQLWYLGAVPIVIGLTEVFKLWISDTRFYPLIAIILGIGINLLIGWAIDKVVVESIIAGLIAGLMACGLYSAVTTQKEGALADKKKRLKAINKANAPPNNIGAA